MSWYLYIAESSKGKFYVGITTEPKRRIEDHNKGNGSRMAKIEGPFRLIYTSLPMANQSEARKREIQIKGWTRAKKQKLIKGELE